MESFSLAKVEARSGVRAFFGALISLLLRRNPSTLLKHFDHGLESDLQSLLEVVSDEGDVLFLTDIVEDFSCCLVTLCCELLFLLGQFCTACWCHD